MLSKSFTIENEVGLHARPAALFVQTAAKFKSKVLVKNNTRGTPYVDAKSILSVMGLGVSKGHRIEIAFEGIDEETALTALTRLIDSDFAEEV
jgi:phosphotransferase system HPr (HPr) family protein